MKGALWSLLAGTVGAAGAFCVLLAFGAKGTPPVSVPGPRAELPGRLPR